MSNIKLSQHFEVVPPQKQKVYAVSIKEWHYLKQKIEKDKKRNWFHEVGSLFIGASITTLITAVSNDFASDRNAMLCWMAFIVTLVIGITFYFFSGIQRKMQQESRKDIIEHMDLIEDKYIKDS